MLGAESARRGETGQERIDDNGPEEIGRAMAGYFLHKKSQELRHKMFR